LHRSALTAIISSYSLTLISYIWRAKPQQTLSVQFIIFGSGKSLKIIIEGKAYNVHVRDNHRALEDAKFKVYILKLAEPTETPMENKEVTTLAQKAYLSEQKNSVVMYVVLVLDIVNFSRWLRRRSFAGQANLSGNSHQQINVSDKYCR
jgi:hypothetical protein